MYFAGVKSFKAIFAQNKNEKEAEFQKRIKKDILHIATLVCMYVCIYEPYI